MLSQTVLQFNNGGANGAYTGGGTGAGTVGAVYEWANVGTENGVTIKAKIEIISIIGGATLTTIDGSTNTADWEPQVSGPSTSSGNSWGIKFKVSFFNASNDAPYSISSFVLQGIDIDGGGGGSAIREYSTFDEFSGYTLEDPSELTVNSTADGTQFLAPQTGFSGISIANTTVIVSCNYTNKNYINVICGVKCVGGSCSGNRLHSMNFRNQVTFISPVTLPVELINFEAIMRENNNALIQWSTASEINSNYFTLEKWTKTSDTENIYTVNAANNSTSKIDYSFQHELLTNEIYYFRLKQVDFNGKINYSNIISLDNRTKQLELVSKTNTLGQNIDDNYQGIIISHYKDGSTSKSINHN